MWVLTLVDDSKEEFLYVTTRKPEYFVGRANADLTLTGDSSISRKHTSICIANKDQCPYQAKTRTGIWIKDHGSKYGTYVEQGQDWIKINPNENKPIEHGTYIRFGIVLNIWRAEYSPLVICPSTLAEEQINQLKAKLTDLDGILTTQFHPRCSFIVTPSFTLSLKVLLALINGIPIVTPAYFDEMCKAVHSKSKLPDSKLFLPPLAEAAIKKDKANFNHGHNRKELFKGLTFYVGKQDQLETLKVIIESAGGNICLFTDANTKKLLTDGAILLEPRQSSSQSQTQSQWSDSITNILERNGKRTVPEREIPLAIVYASIEKHCNPTFMGFSPMLHSENANTPSCLASSIIVEASEPIQEVFNKSHRVVEASISQGVKSVTGSIPNEAIAVDSGSATRQSNVFTQASAKDRPAGSSNNGMPSREPTAMLILSKESALSKPPSLDLSSNSKKETPVGSSGTKFAVPARKRSVSTDIFEEERPNKRPASAINPFASNSRTVPKTTWLLDEDNSMPSSGSSARRKSPSPPTTSGSRRRREDDNPFGANLSSSTPIPCGKRQYEDSEDVSFYQGDKRQRIQDFTPIQRSKAPEVTPVLSRPDLIPRPPPKPAVAETTMPVGERGFIDMSFKKDGPEDNLGKTIIMMSMVSVNRLQAGHHSVAVDFDEPDGARNVKVFRKQMVVNGSHTIPLESLEAPTLTNTWTPASS